MGVRLSSNNHCKSKLSWDEEYPEIYLFSISKGRNEPSSIQQNNVHPCQANSKDRDEFNDATLQES
ncbi:hypothetical protein [Pelolinea submarina]|uniref:Uncharacterized protein n=1 Tax=Pelolinea submarina TaxID=913107 RepID=A0A3E0AB13_9CHLR|nr:hypothetical protein [Pelolinea submarina]REG08673.1 hypothetical protein DFR64_2045 [Pelolinea submarina]